jgi:hypothetical protein
MIYQNHEGEISTKQYEMFLSSEEKENYEQGIVEGSNDPRSHGLTLPRLNHEKNTEYISHYIRFKWGI